MRWYLDTHKYISEITRQALQIIVKHSVTSDSSETEIEAVERELTEAGIYKSYSSAKGRVRRALFTYFKLYGCLDHQGQLTETGKLYSENKLSVQEFCFHFIVNFKYTDNDISYYPVELILRFLRDLGSVSSEVAYLTAYDFSRLAECNSLADINEEFISRTLEAREQEPIEVDNRSVGYDIWSKMIVNAGILERTQDRTLRIKNIQLVDWILSAYQPDNIVVKGKLVTGILNDIPILEYGRLGNWEQFKEEGTALQAFLFEGVDTSVIERYIKKSQEDSFGTMLSNIGLTYTVSSFYKDFIGLEKLVACRLEEHTNISCKIIGNILLNSDIVPPIVIDDELPITGSNEIYYGAPGTGKSHKLNERSKDFDYLERVTFYPEYDHNDFIGCFMPRMSYAKDEDTEYILVDGTRSSLPGKPVPYYSFVPGPFTNALVEAYNFPGKNVLLIVEELNRANAAAVFGEFFQLLDRMENGESKYSISVSNEFSEYLSSKIETYTKGQKVKIPKNLSIYATMNSADQGVNPLDSAFKRRWNFIYIPIDFSIAEHKNYEIDYANSKVTWETFATRINSELKNKGMNEDKHLGQYYITKFEVEDRYQFASKILLYLYDDVLKFNRKGFFKTDYKTFSDLLFGFLDGEKVFEFEFTNTVMDNVIENEVDDQTQSMVSVGIEINSTVPTSSRG